MNNDLSAEAGMAARKRLTITGRALCRVQFCSVSSLGLSPALTRNIPCARTFRRKMDNNLMQIQTECFEQTRFPLTCALTADYLTQAISDLAGNRVIKLNRRANYGKQLCSIKTTIN